MNDWRAKEVTQDHPREVGKGRWCKALQATEGFAPEPRVVGNLKESQIRQGHGFCSQEAPSLVEEHDAKLLAL